jgi:hypothetical protein
VLHDLVDLTELRKHLFQQVSQMQMLRRHGSASLVRQPFDITKVQAIRLRPP